MDIVATVLSLDSISNDHELLETLSHLAKYLHKDSTEISENENYRIMGALFQDYLLKSDNFNIKMVILCCFMELMIKFAPEDPFSSDEYKKEILNLFSFILTHYGKVSGKTQRRIGFLISSFHKIHAYRLFIELENEHIEYFIQSLYDYFVENLFSVDVEEIILISKYFYENVYEAESILHIIFDTIVKVYEKDSSQMKIVECFVANFFPKYYTPIINVISGVIFSIDPENVDEKAEKSIVTCLKMIYCIRNEILNAQEMMLRILKLSQLWSAGLRLKYCKIYLKYLTEKLKQDKNNSGSLIEAFCQLAFDNSSDIRIFFGINFVHMIADFDLYDENNLKYIRILIQDKKVDVRKDLIITILDTILQNINHENVYQLIECAMIALFDKNRNICSLVIETISKLYIKNESKANSVKLSTFSKFEKIFFELLVSPFHSRDLMIIAFYKYILQIFEEDNEKFSKNLLHKYESIAEKNMKHVLFQIMTESKVINEKLLQFIKAESADSDASILIKKQICAYFHKSENIFEILDIIHAKYKSKEKMGNQFMEIVMAKRGIAGMKYLINDFKTDIQQKYQHLSKSCEIFLNSISLRLFYDEKRMISFMKQCDDKIKLMLANNTQNSSLVNLFDLLIVIAKNFPSLFFCKDILMMMITFICQNEHETLKILVLKTLSYFYQSKDVEKEIIQLTSILKESLKTQTGKTFKQYLNCLYAINQQEYESIIKKTLPKLLKSNICFKDGIFINHFIKNFDWSSDADISSLIDIFMNQKIAEMSTSYPLCDNNPKIPKLDDNDTPIEKIIIDLKIVTNYVIRKTNVKSRIFECLIKVIKNILQNDNANDTLSYLNSSLLRCACTQHLKIASHPCLKSYIEPIHEYYFFSALLKLDISHIDIISNVICKNIKKFSLNMMYAAMLVCLSSKHSIITKKYVKMIKDIREIIEILNIDEEKKNLLKPENILIFVAYMLIEYKDILSVNCGKNWEKNIIKMALNPLASGKNYYSSYNIITTLDACMTVPLNNDNLENHDSGFELSKICQLMHESLNEIVKIKNIVLSEKTNIPISKRYFLWKNTK